MADMVVRLASIVCLLAALPAAANVAASTRVPAAFSLSSGTARTRSEVLSEKLLRTREVSVRFDGELLPVADPLGPTSGSGEAAPAPSSPEQALGHALMERFGFTLTLPTGREGERVVRGVMQLERRFLPSGYVWPAVQARHVLLSSEPGRAIHWDIDYPGL